MILNNNTLFMYKDNHNNIRSIVCIKWDNNIILNNI